MFIFFTWSILNIDFHILKTRCLKYLQIKNLRNEKNQLFKKINVSVTVDLENYHFELSDITYEFKKINFSSYHNRNYKDYVVFVFNETASSLTLTESQKDSISSLLVGNNSFALRIEVSEKVKSSKPFNIPLRYYYESKFPVGVENLITLKPEFH